MAQTPQEFFKENMKWLALIFFCLFMLSSLRSCNNNMGARITEKKNIHTIDSLNKKYDILLDTVKQLRFKSELQNERVNAAVEKALAIQSVAEKIKSNTTTTVNVSGAQIDTVKRKKQ